MLLDVKRFSTLYQKLGYKHITRRLLNESDILVSQFPELKCTSSQELSARSMAFMARIICDHRDIKLGFKYRLNEKELVPSDLLKKYIIEVRDNGLPQYRQVGSEKQLFTSKMFGLFLHILMITGQR